MVDGFKPGQRKILFCAFKRNLKQDIKVAQLVSGLIFSFLERGREKKNTGKKTQPFLTQLSSNKKN